MTANKNAFTLVELIITIAIFTFILSIGLVLLKDQINLGSKESANLKTIQEGFVSDLILTKDIAMAGLGFPIEHNNFFVPIGVKNNTGSNGSDELYIRGTIISSGSFDYLKWSYTKSPIEDLGGGKYKVEVSIKPEDTSINYPDEIKNLFTLHFKPERKNKDYTHPFEENDKIIFLNADTKQLLSDNIYTIEEVDETSITFSPPSGKDLDFNIMPNKKALVFCIGRINKDTFTNLVSDDNFTGYRLSTTTQDFCAPGTRSLVRVYGSSMPILDCVLNFQVQLKLDNENDWKNIELTQTNHPYTSDYLKEHLKLIKVFIVKQFGKRDFNYTYPSNKISVADKEINLTSEQRHYRWQTITLVVPLIAIRE